MPQTESRIAENYHRVMQRIESACRRAGRAAGDVRLVAVTKYARFEWVRSLVNQGAVDLGESRPQQLAERVPLLPESIRWHMIGHLQRNKARRLLPLATLIHSVDTLRLLQRIDELADELHLQPRVLLEVNISGESTKGGFPPEALTDAWDDVLQSRCVRIQGLMTMAPFVEDPESARAVFRRLRELRDVLAARSPFDLPELSMGMSNDFEVAIEEGATLVRIGSSLFEGLDEGA
jgi:PLP dependent protein